jgi:integrase
MSLTAVAVAKAKPREKPYKLGDGRGLYLLVTPQGGRYWRFNYRFAGKAKTLAFGVFPDVSLADAREQRDAARRIVAAKRDPKQERKREEREARLKDSETFRKLSEEYLERLEKQRRAASTLKKNRWLLEHCYDALGDRPMSQITAAELLEVLRKIEARGRYETAIRLRSTFSSLFRYAIVTGRADRDPAYDLRGALITPKPNHRAAIIEPKEVGALLRAIDDYEGQAEVRIALRMLPHVFTRPGELRLAKWSEIDREEEVWVIPAERTKMRRRHRVPLSIQVLDLLAELRRAGGRSEYLFPSIRSQLRPISDNTLNAALRRLGYDKSQMTAHGFRATACTLLNEMCKWHPDAIERQLGHVESNDVRRAYARGEHWLERVKMMQCWSDYLDKLKTGAKILKGRFGQRRA